MHLAVGASGSTQTSLDLISASPDPLAAIRGAGKEGEKIGGRERRGVREGKGEGVRIGRGRKEDEGKKEFRM